MVDFLFLEEPQTDARVVGQGDEGRPTPPTMLDGVIAAYADAPWDAETLKAALEMVGEKRRAEARQGPGAGTGRDHRPHRRSAAVRIARGARP